ncbi:MAG: Fe-S cluster assembly scaffold SufA [Rhodospirillaceae bacterium]|jgi:iron-sulfur cluster assembly protein|nr:Fe-S cluster assembly scaffold SufA [Rhodospirillaceae bacterium]|tara:strand:- start:64 stop:402 length:339 start_codon:yes stop_codon:yes gene_type:complete
MNASASLILTESAVSRVKNLMGRTDKPVLGLRVGVTTMGCNGHSYKVEYAEEERPLEEVIEQDGVKIYVDPLAMMYIFGSKMDYIEDKMQSGFVFENPNETGRCGCGESFSV